MHGSHRGVGERLSGQGRAEQHGFPSQAILAVFAGGNQIACQQPQGLASERIRYWVLAVTAGVGLDGMYHRVDAGGGGDQRWQAGGQLGIEDDLVGIQLVGHDAHFGRLAGGQDGDVGHLRASACGSGDLHQWQACALDLADTVQVGQCLLGGDQHRGQFGDVHR
ncbi:hypothetical protein D3C78_1139690 [compost metagenome]